MTIDSFSECNCGAVTLYFTNGHNNSVLKSNLEKFGIVIPQSCEKLHDTYCCNHCVNHYGIDLCACGSGESPEECKAGFDECGNSYETLGQSVGFNPKI